MSKQPVQKHLFHVLTLALVIILLGGGVALLSQWHQGTTPSHATSSDSVVGPPSLPAALVNKIFQQLGSPMAGTGQAVEAASRAENIDDAFALAVWWTETNDGEAGVGLHDLNPGSVRGSTGYPSAYDGYTIYPSFTAAVNYWFGMLKKVYIARGLTTVSSISHPYVGTSTSNLWAGKVIALMQRYRAEAPPPAPPTPTVSADLKRLGRTLQQQAQTQKSSGGVLAVTPTPQQRPSQQVSTTAVAGLAANTKTLLVLFDLLLALVLGMWAVGISRRSSGRAQSFAQPTGNVWEQLRASQQQPAVFLNSFSGHLRVSGDLATSVPNTEALVTTSPLLPTYTANAAGAFTTGQLPFPTAYPAFVNQFNAPAPDYPGLGHVPTHGSDLPGLPTPPASYAPGSANLRSSLPDAGQTRQSPALDPSQQPQPVGVGVGGGRAHGLLSRYREMQEQSERVQR